MEMKRYLALLLALCLLLCACGKKDDTSNTEGSSEATQNNAWDNAWDETQSNNTEETKKKEVLYRHPLTGAALEQPWSGQIPAVMINNLKAAMPQHGISQADIFYEIEVEGDITRNLAVFSDLTKVTTIGPVRSARTAFNSVAVSYDAPLVHCGGSPGLALAGRYGASMDTIANWQHIDQGSNGAYFFRDQVRYQNGYAWEHTLFTKGELLQQVMEKKGYYTPDEKNYGLQFAEDVTLSGEQANEVTVKFKSGKTTTLKYDAATKEYKLFMHGTEHIDGNTGKALTFKNVIAIYTDQKVIDSGGHKVYETIGSGEGYAAINGQIVPIKWSREGLRTHYTYTLADGTPLTMDVGTTYIALVGIKNPISYK